MIVLDASAAIEIARGTEHGKRYLSLMFSGERVISVDLMHAEVAYVFSKYVKGGEYTAQQAARLAERAVSIVDKFYPMSSLYTEALNEAIRLQHSPYDLFYFILARRTGATLFTRDSKLAKLCVQNGVNCVRELSAGEEDYTTHIAMD